MNGVINAYITNLGRYNEGELCGEWLAFPTTPEAVQGCLQRIGIDGERYEEWFITDYETDVDGLYDVLGEYESLDQLNYLASLLGELQGDYHKLTAALAYESYSDGLTGIINLVRNLDTYTFYEGITDEEELGRFYIEECSSLEVPASLQNYIDYEAYGRDVALEEGGIFTQYGYFISDGFADEYDGITPENYRVHAAPKRAAFLMPCSRGGEKYDCIIPVRRV